MGEWENAHKMYKKQIKINSQRDYFEIYWKIYRWQLHYLVYRFCDAIIHKYFTIQVNEKRRRVEKTCINSILNCKIANCNRHCAHTKKKTTKIFIRRNISSWSFYFDHRNHVPRLTLCHSGHAWIDQSIEKETKILFFQIVFLLQLLFLVHFWI